MKVQIPDSEILPAFDVIWIQCWTPQNELRQITNVTHFNYYTHVREWFF